MKKWRFLGPSKYDPVQERIDERFLESIQSTGLPRLKIISVRPPGMISSRFLKKLLCDLNVQMHSTYGKRDSVGVNSE
jgi:hypothetical protein